MRQDFYRILWLLPIRIIPPARHFVLLMYYQRSVNYETVSLTEIILFLLPSFINKDASVVYDMKYLCVCLLRILSNLEFFRRICVLCGKLELPLTVFHNASISQNCITYWTKKYICSESRAKQTFVYMVHY
jgi:hypothetical protein